MRPTTDRHTRSFNELFAAAVADGKAQRATARAGRQENVVRGVIAEIENALETRAAIPIDPRGDRKILTFGDGWRQLKVTVGAVHDNGLAVLTGGVTGNAHGKAIVAVTGTVQHVVF